MVLVSRPPWVEALCLDASTGGGRGASRTWSRSRFNQDLIEARRLSLDWGFPLPVVAIISYSSFPLIPSREDFLDFFDKGDFNLEVIEAIRNLPECSFDSLNIFVESGSRGVGNSHLPLDEALDESGVDGTESSIAPQSRSHCRAINVDNCKSSVSVEEFEIFDSKINSSSEFVFVLPSASDRIKFSPLGFFTAYCPTRQSLVVLSFAPSTKELSRCRNEA
ncbi:UNVERIFIED_CONTAM: hypothetical protein Sradi_2332500 [Sesamum radiatum]|uniref:Uncharacterized protein n=1 Tax=Sesamum radiatum TaxID=300843 RepID=A0AAW2T6C0_SESRA